MIRPVNCICENCECKTECAFYEETIKPYLEVVITNQCNDTEPFIACLIRNLNDFECEYFEREKTKE